MQAEERFAQIRRLNEKILFISHSYKSQDRLLKPSGYNSGKALDWILEIQHAVVSESVFRIG